MKIGIPKEINDRRVAMVPSVIPKFKDLGVEFLVEKGAGNDALIFDNSFDGLAEIVERDYLLANSDIILSLNPLTKDEYKAAKSGALALSMFQPYFDDSIIGMLEEADVKGMSFDMIPRTTLAQSMDVLSSMASVAGYKAVLEAANHLTRYFPMMITAAGSIKPAKVLILGAGVAGLQAIASARRLGAMVEVFDTRSAVKEEVMSLGGKFIEVEGAKEDTGAGGYAVQQTEEFLQRQRQEVQNRAMKADVIITTAQVRGRKAPLLVSKETVDGMRTGSVIVDLASSTGGNCELSEDNKTIVYNGVTIIGNSNLAATMPEDSSVLYSNNALNLLKILIKDGQLNYDMENEIIKGSLITTK